MDKLATEPQIAKDAVLVSSNKLPDDTPQVKGYDWNDGINYEQLLDSYVNSGFQATNFGKAVNEINKMVMKIVNEFVAHFLRSQFHSLDSQLDCRETGMEDDNIDYYEDDEFIKRKSNCTIFLGFTSNIVSSGLRETIRFLVQHKMVKA